MNKFIMCFDEETKEILESQGCRQLYCKQIDDKQCWVYQNSNKLNFDKIDGSKVILTNRLNF